MPRSQLAVLTLREFFEQHFVPEWLDEAEPGTVTAYREALAHWERITGDPPLWRIDRPIMQAFKAGLLALIESPAKAPSKAPWESQRTLFACAPEAPARPRGKRAMTSKTTVNKHINAVHRLLRKAGPPGPRHWDAMEILPAVPYVKPCRRIKRCLPRRIKPEVLVAIYRACSAAVHPLLDGVMPEAWWKGLIVAAGLVGLRRGALLTYEDRGKFHPGLEWDWVDLATGLVRVDPEVDKRDREREKPLHAVVVRHLMRIRSDCRYVFPWPASLPTLRRQWLRIQEAADVAERDRITIHDLKRYCGSLFAQMGSPWLVHFMLDHAAADVAGRHYVNPTDEAMKLIAALPVPEAFSADFASDAG